MKAVYKNKLYVIHGSDMDSTIKLAPFGGGEILEVALGDPDLIIDPTDDEYFACNNAPQDITRREHNE